MISILKVVNLSKKDLHINFIEQIFHAFYFIRFCYHFQRNGFCKSFLENISRKISKKFYTKMNKMRILRLTLAR